MQVNVISQLGRDVHRGDQVVEEGVRLMGGGLLVLVHLLAHGRISERGRELVPEALRYRVKWISVAGLQNCIEWETHSHIYKISSQSTKVYS